MLDYPIVKWYLFFMQINKKTKTITINGLDLLKAMENAKTPINPFYRQKGKNVKNKTKPRVSK